MHGFSTNRGGRRALPYDRRAPGTRPPRWFAAADILAGRVDLDGYPFRYIYVSITLGFPTCRWEVVSFERGGEIACLRGSVS